MLDVVIALHGQAMAPLETASLEHSAAVGSLHALTEPVHADTTANLRLIRTFYHNNFLTSPVISQDTVALTGVGFQTKRDYTLRVWFGQTKFL
jgi:hypothetical protein